MPQLDPWRTDPDAYPFAVTTQTRFQDLDPQGHVNNVAMAGFFENGRVRFADWLKLREIVWETGGRVVVAHVAIDYLAEAHFPDDIIVASASGRIGTRSWDVLSAAFQHGRCVAACRSTLVASIPIPPALRAVLEASGGRGG